MGDGNFKLKLCTSTQSMALGTRTKFLLEILIKSTISAREKILESSRNVSEIPFGGYFTTLGELSKWVFARL